VAKRANWTAWGLVAVVSVGVLGGCSAYAFTQFLSIRRGFQQWSLDEDLRQAALVRDASRVGGLLAQGANIHARDERGSTALLMAGDHEPLVRLLLLRGADVNARDHYQWTALMSAAASRRTSLVKLLLSKGANVNARDLSGRSVLDYAKEAGSREVIALLKQAGAAK
jgi:uncharacterized protein